MATETRQGDTATTKDTVIDSIQASTPDKGIGGEKVEEHQKPIGNITRKDPEDLTDLFSRLFRSASAAYYESLGSAPPNDLEAKIKTFAERAASHPVIGRSFFLSLEQPNRLSAEPPLTAADHQELASLAAAATRAVSEQAMPQQTTMVEETTQAPGADTTRDLVQETDAAIENIVLQAYEKLGMQGVNALRRQLLTQLGGNPILLAKLNSQIDATVKKHNLDKGSGAMSAEGLPKRISGSFEEVALQATMLLKQHKGDARFALALGLGPLAAALEEMENVGLARERQVDLMIHLFAGEPVYHGSGTRPPCNQEFRQFLARLRALAQSEIQGQATPDQLETLVNLTIWYGQAEERACIACGADLALDILPHFYDLQDQPVRVAVASRMIG